MEIKKGIYCSLDWYQAVFHDVDFHWVLRNFLGLTDLPFDDKLLSDAIEIKSIYADDCGFEYNGIKVLTHKSLFETCHDVGVFHTVFEYVQLIISGDGIRYLRSLGLDPDNYLRQNKLLDDDGVEIGHLTRVDHAFDLINYRADFVDKCLDFLSDYKDGYGIRLSGNKKPTKFSCRTGSEKTIYVGCNRSGSMLRIYDKMMEQTKRGKLCMDALPVEVDFPIESWVRIELQARGDSETYTFGISSFEGVFKAIFNKFTFLDREGNPAQFWLDLFEWDTIHSIIQNANSGKPQLTISKVLRKQDRVITQSCAYVLYYGIDKWFDMIKQRILDISSLDMDNSYVYANMLKTLSVLCDPQYDSDGRLIIDRTQISSLEHVQIIPHNGFELICYKD